MIANFDSFESHYLEHHSEPNILTKTLLNYINYVEELELSLDAKKGFLTRELAIAQRKANATNQSFLYCDFYRKKANLIKALQYSYKNRDGVHNINALYFLNETLREITHQDLPVVRFDGTIPDTAQNARDEAYNKYIQTGNSVHHFLLTSTPQEICDRLIEITRTDLSKKYSHIKIANDIIEGKISIDDSAEFCFLMRMICDTKTGVEPKNFSHSKLHTYDSYASMMGSFEHLENLYNEAQKDYYRMNKLSEDSGQM